MELGNKGVRVLCVGVLIIIVAGVSFGHWEEGDDYKMHYPQLPDPDGWGVAAQYDYCSWLWWEWGTRRGLADDWLCTETGYVEDIHFWGSWKGDIKGTVHNIAIGIFADDSGEPGTLLWHRNFDDSYFHEELAGSGSQGWYDPYSDSYIEGDHEKYYQYNIPFIDGPLFYQEEGNIYWLGISINYEGCEFGWKTSDDHWGSDAVYLTNMKESPPYWEWAELYNPLPPGESLDLAFVITPEPATLLLLGLGGISLRKRRP
ncbi:MAG: PEP-CTERM sorting domain-containing protein [Sedimentisphaerales bacterium]|nr:PEP-CTERM sorting domain-containing protein [Sedimentisphaerales bacterium]